jgi:hypothetical protein
MVCPSDASFPSACRRILNDHRAILNAGTASGATIFDDRAGPFFDFDLEIARGSLHAFQVCIGDQFDVQVPADLDQFR